MSINSLTAGSLTAGSNILSSLSGNSSTINNIQTQLSTNKKTLDPAQQGVVTRLTSQVTSFGAAHNNIAKAQNVLNVAKTGLYSIAKILTQMQDLANKMGAIATTQPVDYSSFYSLQSQYNLLKFQYDSAYNQALAECSTLGSIETGNRDLEQTNLNYSPILGSLSMVIKN